MARVLLFGRLADIAGWRERLFEPTPATLSALRCQLEGLDPALGEALAGKGVTTAVARLAVRGDVALTPGVEVAFMPPMSGG